MKGPHKCGNYDVCGCVLIYMGGSSRGRGRGGVTASALAHAGLRCFSLARACGEVSGEADGSGAGRVGVTQHADCPLRALAGAPAHMPGRHVHVGKACSSHHKIKVGRHLRDARSAITSATLLTPPRARLHFVIDPRTVPSL